MKIILIGANGKIGELVQKALAGAGHEIVKVGHKSGDFQVEIENRESVRKLYQAVGSFDAVAIAAGQVAFAPLSELTAEKWQFSLGSKLMGQINLVQEAIPFIKEKGSFTLVSGILNDDPIFAGVAASTVSGALEAFVRAAAIELPKGLRINVVSPTMLKESESQFAQFFTGMIPVEGWKVGQAYKRAILGAQTGRVYKVIERFVNGHINLRRYLIMKLTSNTILITGGASGIGYELTKQLTALGNTILITGRDQAKMDRAKAAFPKIHTFRSDVSDPKAIATLYEEVTKQFPELNILINNAGIMRKINVHDKAGSLEDITREIEINLSGPIRMVKQFLPHLKTKSEAAIMNVSSGLAFVPLPISPVYCATKAGLHSFTESLRVQLKNTKVKVFDLAPPAIQTELLGDFNV